MSNYAKRKGSGAERDVVIWLKDNGYQYADRRLAGATLDKGDAFWIPYPCRTIDAIQKALQ